MRTFPKALAQFREIVEHRALQLRTLPVEELRRLDGTTEHLDVDSRPSTMSIIVQPQPSGATRVIVQGFMKAKLLWVSHVALAGFYKYPDNTTADMPNDEFWEFD